MNLTYTQAAVAATVLEGLIKGRDSMLGADQGIWETLAHIRNAMLSASSRGYGVEIVTNDGSEVFVDPGLLEVAFESLEFSSPVVPELKKEAASLRCHLKQGRTLVCKGVADE